MGGAGRVILADRSLPHDSVRGAGSEVKMITSIEASKLEACEAVIERGLNTFVEVGAALLSIRDERLYREAHETFEEYCRERWGMQRNYANKMIAAAEVVNNLGTIVPIIPATESQARPLTALEPEQQREVWAMAVETAPNGKVTASHVERVVQEYIEPRVKPIEKYKHISDDSYEWYTPSEYIEAARLVMSGIDLDPASCVEAQETVKAIKFYTIDDDGLSKDWRGKVWLNPPYCMPEIERFVDRAIDLHAKGHVKQAIILTNNSTDTAWFHRLLAYSKVVCLTKGRVKFWGPDGGATTGARQGQAIFYMGDNVKEFIRRFREFGAIVRTV